jgi:hypothetical protein
MCCKTPKLFAREKKKTPFGLGTIQLRPRVLSKRVRLATRRNVAGDPPAGPWTPWHACTSFPYIAAQASMLSRLLAGSLSLSLSLRALASVVQYLVSEIFLWGKRKRVLGEWVPESEVGGGFWCYVRERRDCSVEWVLRLIICWLV